MTDTEKLEKIARIVSIQTDNANDEEEGDRHLADPVLAMEAIENVLCDISNGALRQYEEAGA